MSGDGLCALGVVPWVISAKGEVALRAQADRLRRYVFAEPGLGSRNVAFSLVGRAAWEYRSVVLGGDGEGLLRGLSAVAAGGELAAGDRAVSVVSGVADGDGVVFVLPGQGSQWVGMGAELLASSDVFAARMAECADALAGFVDWSLEGVLRGDSGAPSLDRVDVVQPVLFAVMVSLAGLWLACGVRPDAVVGHSQGEIAAAHVAGVL